MACMALGPLILSLSNREWLPSHIFLFERKGGSMVVVRWGDLCGFNFEQVAEDPKEHEIWRGMARDMNSEWFRRVYFEEPLDNAELARLCVKGGSKVWGSTLKRGIDDQEERAFLQKYAPLVVKSVEPG